MARRAASELTSSAYSSYFSCADPCGFAADGVLEQRDRLGVPHVVLAVAPPGVDAADGQQVLVRARPRAGVAVERLAGQHAEPDAADARGGAREVAIDERLLEADGLEDLRAAVALDGRDPHLGDRLEQGLAQALDDPPLGLLGILHARDAPVARELVDRVEHEIGVDRARAVADEHGEVMHLARLAGLEHEARAQARALAHEVMVHGADGQQRRDRRAVRAGRAIGEDEDVDAGRDVVGRLVAHVGQALLHPCGALVDRPRDVDRVGAEDVRGDRAQRLELGVAQDRLLHHELMGVLRRLGEQVALGADARAQRHDDRLARGVDRRVGHLREELLEVAEQRRALVGEDRQRGVVAHRADGLLARARHRGVQHAQVLLRVAEGELALAQRELGRGPRRPGLEVVELHDVLVEPGAVGLLGRDPVLDLLVLDDPPLDEVDEEDLARLQAPEALDVLRAHAEHPGLRAQDDVAVLGLHPAPGAQAVAVERGAHDAAVGEGHRRRAVPRLHEARVEGVEALELVGEVVAVLVGLRDHHHHRVRQ